MAWVIVGAGPMGVALGVEGIKRGLGLPVFVEQQESVILKVEQDFATAGAKPTIVRDIGDIDLAQLNPVVIFFAAPWLGIRDTLFGQLERLQLFEEPPVVVGLGSARLNSSDRAGIENSEIKVLLGAGLEPGFAEAMISSVAIASEDCHTITTYCGGVPCHPEPPLFFQRQFGSRPHFQQRLTYRRDAHEILVGNRFRETEPVYFPDIGLLESFDDAMLPDTARDSRIQVPCIAQKTLRWPGYASALRNLHDLGLLNDAEVEVDGQFVNIAKAVENAICKDQAEPSDSEVLFACKTRTSSGQTAALYLICKDDAAQNDVPPMGFMTALPAIAAFECLASQSRAGLYLPSDPALAAIASISLKRFEESGRVQVLRNGEYPKF